MQGSIPQSRVIEKLNEYMRRPDFPGARRHLEYWLAEARVLGDAGGELMVLNELIGHHRKTGEKAEALARGQEALALMEKSGYGMSLSAGTTYVNLATALNAFGENERALGLFQKARAIYESSAGADDTLLGGLYNNMALTLTGLGRHGEARELFRQALERMASVKNGQPERAITLLNLANTLEAEVGMEAAEGRIYDWLDQACELLDDPAVPRDGYYAWVCDHCAPTFEYYGYFEQARALRERAVMIREGT